jgi:adenine-specific DNA-methyltransferase
VGQWYSSFRANGYKKLYGQYFTPVQVAEFMASLCSVQKDVVRILDPGAGAGVLTCAVCEYLATQKTRPYQVIIEAYECDPELFLALKRVLLYLQEFLALHTSVTCVLSTEDFVLKYGLVLEETPPLLLTPGEFSEFDLVISNPPYFKIPKSDPRAAAAAAVVYGQPNIYALFLAISASLLADGGELIAIVPRSFTAGLYFRRFREFFFSKVKLERIHLFTSRRDSFKRDQVLQENVILKTCRPIDRKSSFGKAKVTISSSQGLDDLHSSQSKIIPMDMVLDVVGPDKTLRIPTSTYEERVIRLFHGWQGSLQRYGLEISTGPVVPFRALSFLAESSDVSKTDAPLIWMQSVRVMEILWPADRLRKSQYIRMTPDSMSLLVPDKTYVLLRRVSAKEDKRRLTAAPLIKGMLQTPFIGLENHLNYIHRPGGEMTEDEAWGLAAFYNSSFFDTYFRTLNGNTQVSATELRLIALPEMEMVVEVGHQLRRLAEPQRKIEAIISSVLGQTWLEETAL